MSSALGPPYDPNDADGNGIPDILDQHLASYTPEQLAFIDRLAGPAPTLDTSTEAAPPQTGGQRILGSFAGLEDQRQPPPQSFLQGLVGGAQSGLGAAGTRVQAQRAQLEQGIAKRQAERDAGNSRATAEYRARQGKGRELLAAAELGSAKARAENKTPEQIQAEAKARALGAAQGEAAGGGNTTLDSGDLTPAGLDAAARAYAISGQLPPMGMGKNPLRAKIINRAAELSGPNFNPAANKADLQSEQANLSNLSKQHSSATAYSETANKNADLMLSLINKIPDTGVPLANKLVRGTLERFMGSEDISNFNTALSTVQPEFARILTQGPSGNGQLSDSARHELQAVVSGDFTRKQLAGAIKILKMDAENRKKSYQDAIDETKQRIRSIGSADVAPTGSQRPPLESFVRP